MKTNVLFIALLTFSIFTYGQDDYGSEFDSRTFDRIEESDYQIEASGNYFDRKERVHKQKPLKLIKADLRKSNTSFKNRRSIVKSFKSLEHKEGNYYKEYLSTLQQK